MGRPPPACLPPPRGLSPQPGMCPTGMEPRPPGSWLRHQTCQVRMMRVCALTGQARSLMHQDKGLTDQPPGQALPFQMHTAPLPVVRLLVKVLEAGPSRPWGPPRPANVSAFLSNFPADHSLARGLGGRFLPQTPALHLACPPPQPPGTAPPAPSPSPSLCPRAGFCEDPVLSWPPRFSFPVSLALLPQQSSHGEPDVRRGIR